MSISYPIQHGVSASAVLAGLNLPNPVDGVARLIVPAGKVSSDLSAFPMRVNLASLPLAFWDEVAEDGRDIRLLNGAGTMLPIDLVQFDKVAQTGELFVLTDLRNASDSSFYVKIEEGAEAIDVDSPLGRHAVWGDYACIHIMSSLEDRSGHGLTMVLEGTASIDGWLRINGAGNGRINGVPLLTTWTMGITARPSYVLANGAMISYSPPTTANTWRASLVLRSTPQYGTWNSTNGWLLDTTIVPAIGDRHRFHHVQNANVNRKLYRDGALVDSGVTAQRPVNGGTGPALWLGVETTSYGERFRGALGYSYLREGELSAAWLAAEYQSWETDTFYEVAPGT